MTAAIALLVALAVAGAAGEEPPAPPAPAAAARANLDRAHLDQAQFEVAGPDGPVEIGEWFEVSVTGELADGAALRADGLPEGGRQRPLPPELLPDGRRRVRLQLSLTRRGRHALDALRLLDGGQQATLPPLPVEVALDLPATAIPRVASLLPPVDVPMPVAPSWPFLLALGVGLAAIGAWVAAVGRVVVPVVLPVPPDLLATRALSALRSRIPRLSEEIPPFVDAVSDVLRVYVEARFGVKAPEHTTEEFLAELRHAPGLAQHGAALQPFLTLCDLVKFARHRPGIDQVNDLLVTAEGFVEATRDPGPGRAVEAAA